ncbi:MAG: hypothetical protein OEZ22_11815 [Spirochaetia bacterium]|nr:hypothetical protein [Spirochaetia bacterium]
MQLHSNFHNIDLSNIKKLLLEKQITVETTNDLINYWEEQISNKKNLIFHNYFDSYLFFELMKYSVIKVIFYDFKNDKILYKYGILNDADGEILSSVKNDGKRDEKLEKMFLFEHQNEAFGLWRRKITSHNFDYYFLALFPQELNIIVNLREISQIFLRYFLPSIYKPDNRFMPLFEDVNKAIIEKINPYLESESPVTFSFFKFETFDRYLEFGGEFFAKEVIDDILNEFSTKIKATDNFFVLSPQKYLIVSVDCESDVIKDRFKKLSFKIKSLILNFNVKYSTFYKPINHLSEKWKEIST